jgi:hypothetical protein
VELLNLQDILWVIAIAALAAGFNGPDIRGPFSGQIVEAETHKPIPGAVVVVVWTYAMHGGGRQIDAKEAVTDALGGWYISARPTYFGEGGRGTPRDDRAPRETSVTTMRRISKWEQCDVFLSEPSVEGALTKIPHYFAAVAKTRDELRCCRLRNTHD